MKNDKSTVKSMVEKNKIAFSIIFTSVLIILAGMTYSWYGWKSSENTPISFTMAGVSVVYTTGNSINGILIPTLSHNEKGNISKSVTVKLSYGAAVLDLFLDVDTLPTELQDSTFLWELYKNDNTTPIRSGNFLFSTAGTTIQLLSNQAVTTSQDTYTLYFWIDGRLENPVTIGGKSFSFTLRATASDQQPNLDVSGANEPYMGDDLLFTPVYYDYENTTWRKADVTNTDPDYQWYDYPHHLWANAVELKTVELDEQYYNAPEGTAIPLSDISAFYVWIPRYKYKVWNINKQIGVDSYNAENTGVDIKFEEGEQSTGSVICNIVDATKLETCSGSNGDYYTHPAFHVGERQLTGFWIPKFESTNNDLIFPSYIPDGTSSSKYSLIDYYGSFYDPTFETPNYWPMTSLAWGAIAYLSNSEYGTCADEPIDGDEENTVRVCTPASGQNQIPTATEGVYTTSMMTGDGDYLANVNESTTRNVYGIYDMNGVKGEYTMGIQYDNTNTGINTNLFDTAGIVIKDKFFTPYSYGLTNNDQAAYSRSVLGDAMGEVMKTSTTMWHSGKATSFVHNTEDVVMHTGLFSIDSSSQNGLCVNGTCTSEISEKYGFTRYMKLEINKLF